MSEEIKGYSAVQVAPKTLRATCGWCGRDSWFERRAAVWAGAYSSPYGYGSSPDQPRLAAIYQCPGCANASLVLWHVYFPQYGDPDRTPDGVWPTRRATEMDDVEDPLQVDRLEAWNAHLQGLNRAAILMARSALQRAARHLLAAAGVEPKRRKLEQELDLLVKEGVIIQQLRDNAEEVRLSGNDVAHPEEMEEVNADEAEESLTFLDDFLNTTVAFPARQKKRKAGRDATPAPPADDPSASQ